MRIAATPAASKRSALASIRAAIRAFHPFPCLAIAALGAGAAALIGATPGRVAIIAGDLLAVKVSIGWSNDFFDAEADALAGRCDKPIVQGAIDRRAVLSLALVALGVAIALAWVLGRNEIGYVAIGLAAGWSYNAGLKHTRWSWLPFVVGFGALPIAVWRAADGALPPAWIPTACAFLGLGGHFTNTIPDLDADETAGVRGLPHRIGPTWSLLSAAASLTCALISILIGVGSLHAAGIGVASCATLVLASVVGSIVMGRAGLGFRLTMLAAAADLALLAVVGVPRR
jgi:4-hydroxybenzoate polyprenyltransferase